MSNPSASTSFLFSSSYAAGISFVVNVNGKDYAASGRGSVVIINKDGTIKTDADPFKDAVAGTEFQITVASTGYTTPLTFTYKFLILFIICCRHIFCCHVNVVTTSAYFLFLSLIVRVYFPGFTKAEVADADITAGKTTISVQLPDEFDPE